MAFLHGVGKFWRKVRRISEAAESCAQNLALARDLRLEQQHHRAHHYE
jgi:hypothetical protein